MTVAYSDLTPGTALTWQDSSGTGGAIALNGLTNTSIVQGAKSASLIDGTKGFPELLEVTVTIQFNAAPTAGNEVPVYLGWSASGTAGTDNSGNLSGTSTTGPNADALPQLTLVGSLVASNNLGASTNQQFTTWIKPLREYVMPVVQNSSGVTLKASANVSVVSIRPWYRRAPVA